MFAEEVAELTDWPEDCSRPLSGFAFYDDPDSEWRNETNAMPVKSIVLILSLCVAVAAFAADNLDDAIQQASAEVTAIEPLAAPAFTRTRVSGVIVHGGTREVEVNYKLSPAAPTTAANLRTSIAQLFHDKGWFDGMPDGFSVTSADVHGVVTYPLAFRARFERVPKTYSIHHAYLWISDDLSSIRCTYVFRYTE